MKTNRVDPTTDARLGRGLVFDNEIEAEQWMHIRRSLGSGRAKGPGEPEGHGG